MVVKKSRPPWVPPRRRLPLIPGLVLAALVAMSMPRCFPSCTFAPTFSYTTKVLGRVSTATSAASPAGPATSRLTRPHNARLGGVWGDTEHSGLVLSSAAVPLLVLLATAQAARAAAKRTGQRHAHSRSLVRSRASSYHGAVDTSTDIELGVAMDNKLQHPPTESHRAGAAMETPLTSLLVFMEDGAPQSADLLSLERGARDALQLAATHVPSTSDLLSLGAEFQDDTNATATSAVAQARPLPSVARLSSPRRVGAARFIGGMRHAKHRHVMGSRGSAAATARRKASRRAGARFLQPRSETPIVLTASFDASRQRSKIQSGLRFLPLEQRDARAREFVASENVEEVVEEEE